MAEPACRVSYGWRGPAFFEGDKMDEVVLALVKSHGFAGLIMALIFIQGAQLLTKIFSMWLDGRRQKQLADKATFLKLVASVDKLEKAVEDLAVVKRLPEDMRKFYKALKILAGPRWHEISEELREKEYLDQ